MIVSQGFKLPKGFMAAGVHAGIKKYKKDMSLVYSPSVCTSASTYTTNKVKAAPVVYDMSIKDLPKHGIIANSGNANAVTGAKGLEDASMMAFETAGYLKAKKEDFFVCSTGVIGVHLDMDKIKYGIKELVKNLSESDASAKDASEAILTTDTVRKECSVTVKIDDKDVVVSGFAKGSGMIHPNMATMLCFVTTDCAINHDMLQHILGDTVEDTFNMISVDGDTSTNDTCLVLANGKAGNKEIVAKGEDYEIFKEALSYVLGRLACMIAKDGEGAGRFIEVKVEGAASVKDARILARSVVSSNLVKAAFFGSDANWGRILCAMGYSGASFSPEKVKLLFSSEKGSVVVLEDGEPVKFDEAKAKAILLEPSVSVLAVLSDGEAKATAWGCDLTYDYVRINGDYRS